MQLPTRAVGLCRNPETRYPSPNPRKPRDESSSPRSALIGIGRKGMMHQRTNRRITFLARAFLALVLAAVVVNCACAVEPAAADDRPSFFVQILQNLFNSRGLLTTLGQPEYTAAAFLALNLIVFVET